MKKNAAANLAYEGNELSDLASDLRDAYELLDRLCSQLEGGGIVQARDIRPAIAQAVPRLRHAVTWLNTVTMMGERRPGSEQDPTGDAKPAGKNPLLI